MCVCVCVGSWISYRVHYNEFVKSGSKSWVLMRRRLVLEMKSALNRVAQRPKENGPLARGWGCAISSRSSRSLLPFSGPPFFVRSLLLYILLFCSSSSYTCQSSKSILKCTSHQPSFLALCGLLWPLLFYLGVTSTSTGSSSYSFSSYTCQSSKPILKCTPQRPSFLALCGLLWPLLFCLGVTSTSTGSEC